LAALLLPLIASALVFWSSPPVASADTVSCESCIRLYSCDTDAGSCILDCQGLYRDAPFSLQNCIDGCNRTVDVCVDQAQLECFRVKKCP
jgi:hypothetical protein